MTIPTIIVAAVAIVVLSVFLYRNRIHAINHKTFCSTEHLSEIASLIGDLRSGIIPGKSEGELNKEDLTYKKTQNGLIITYSAVYTEEDYFLHHISLNRLGEPLAAKSASLISTYIVACLGVTSWDYNLQVSKKGFVHLAFLLSKEEHEKMMEQPISEVDSLPEIIKNSYKVKIRRHKPVK